LEACRWRVSLTQQSEGIPKLKLRIETLSDLVFGLALSIGSIALVQHIPQLSGDLINDVVEFGFSFLIIVGVWLGYTRIAAVLPMETPGALVLNLVLLFCVAVEPFMYYVLFQAPSAFVGFASSAYAIDTGAMMGLLSAMMYLVLRQERGKPVRIHPRLLMGFRTSMAAQAIGSLLFLASALGPFWLQIPVFGYLRFLMWYVALGVFFASRVFIRRGPTSEGAPSAAHEMSVGSRPR
jgi:uncharacterized membrane protein